jgi:tetratricopeptide (TPR) repeat protein
MSRSHTAACCVGAFVLGTLVTTAAQNRKPSYTPDVVQGKEPKAAAAALLDGALALAGSGSWERIAVGRAWYLGGDKARGQQILDEVTSSRKVEASDWFRVGRIYSEAGEWDRAREAFEKAIAADKGDDSGMLEYGALANVHGDRARAEDLFARAMKPNPREFWHWVNAGGSYLGVRPQ